MSPTLPLRVRTNVILIKWKKQMTIEDLLKALQTLSLKEEKHEQRTLELLRWALEQEQRCQVNNQWNPPDAEQVPERLCRHCLIRWSCPSVHFAFPWERSDEASRYLEGYDP